jgi:hypothetical protein
MAPPCGHWPVPELALQRPPDARYFTAIGGGADIKPAPIPQFISKRSKRTYYGAGGRTRTGTVLANRGIFVPLRLSPPCQTRSRVRLVCGLDYTFTLALSRVRRCPSSLYTFAPAVRPVRLARDCLLAVSPNLSSSTPRVSQRALNLLSPLRLPVPPRPLWSQDQILSAFFEHME